MEIYREWGTDIATFNSLFWACYQFFKVIHDFHDFQFPLLGLLAFKGFDRVELNYGSELKAVLRTETSTMRRKIEIVSSINAENSGSVLLPTDILNRVVQVLDGNVRVTFTEGPITISKITENYSIHYIIAPLVE